MELRNINTFLKVAATQNFSKAAEQLGLSICCDDSNTAIGKRTWDITV